MANNDNTKTIAIAAGVGLLLYLLFRGGGPLAFGKDRGTKPSRQNGVPKRCSIVVSGAGLTLNGKPMPMEAAVALCQAGPRRADVVVVGNARYGDVQTLRKALDDAGVATTVSRPFANKRKTEAN